MTIDDRIKQIYEIWHSIEHDTRWDLGKIWLEKDKLEYMEARVEELEDKVLHLLKIIKELKHDRKELKKHMEHLLRLLHHVKPEREWQRDIKEELDETSREIRSAEDKIIAIAMARMEARRQRISAKSPISLTSAEPIRQIDVRIELVDHRGRDIGFMEGRFEFNNQITFKLKKINLIGIMVRRLLQEIISKAGVWEEINRNLSKSRNDDPINVNIIFDYGDLLPIIKITWGQFVDSQTKILFPSIPPLYFNEDNLPQVRLIVKNIRIDENTRPLTIFVEAGL